jgi:hypothetical protein
MFYKCGEKLRRNKIIDVSRKMNCTINCLLCVNTLTNCLPYALKTAGLTKYTKTSALLAQLNCTNLGGCDPVQSSQANMQNHI